MPAPSTGALTYRSAASRRDEARDVKSSAPRAAFGSSVSIAPKRMSAPVRAAASPKPEPGPTSPATPILRFGAPDLLHGPGAEADGQADGGPQ